MANQYIELIKNKYRKFYNSAGQARHKRWQIIHNIWKIIVTSEVILDIMPFIGTIFPKNFRIKKNTSTGYYFICISLLWFSILPLIIILKNDYDSKILFNSHPIISFLIALYFLFIFFIIILSMFIFTPLYRFIKFKKFSIWGKRLLKGDYSNWVTYKSYFFSLGVISYFIKSLIVVFFAWVFYHTYKQNPIVFNLENETLNYIIFYSTFLYVLSLIGLISILIAYIFAFPYDYLRNSITKNYIFTSEYPKKILDRCDEVYGEDIKIDLSYNIQELTLKNFRNESLYNQLKHSLIDPLMDLEDILIFIIMGGLKKLPKQNMLTWKYFTGTSQISREEINNYVLNLVEMVYLYGTKDSSSDKNYDLKTQMSSCLTEFFDKLEKDGYYPLEDFIEKLEDIKIKGTVEHWKTKEKKGHLNYINIISENSYISAERHIAYYVFAMTLIMLVFTLINILF